MKNVTGTKSLLAALLCMALSVTACNNNGNDATSAKEDTVQTKTDTSRSDYNPSQAPVTNSQY